MNLVIYYCVEVDEALRMQEGTFNRRLCGNRLLAIFWPCMSGLASWMH